MEKIAIDNIEYESFDGVTNLFKKCLFNPLLNYVLPAGFLKKILTNSKSALAHESLVDPGNWQSMKLSYENNPPKDFLDKMVLQYGAFPAGLRNRKKLVVLKLSNLIKKYKDQENILIVGVGAGRGFNAMDSMVASGLKNVEGYFLDIDDSAMEPGKELAKSLGLSNKVKFIQGNAIDLKKYIPKNADILKLIGIIEYLTDDQVSEILDVGYKNMNKGSTVIVNTIEPTHGIEPFLQKTFNLKLNYRTTEQVQKLLVKSGFSILEDSKEALNIYHILTAVK